MLTARPATPLAEIEALLAERRQHLAFEPPDLGAAAGRRRRRRASNIGGTLGGAISCNLAGPRRIKAGAARDHVLGFHAVSGRGEAFKAGGRVVKNVTGFDLSKLIAGSFGTLAVMTELTVRALPAPEETRTLVVLGLDDSRRAGDDGGAGQRLRRFRRRPPAGRHRHDLGRRRRRRRGGFGDAAAAGGPRPSVAFRLADLSRLLRRFGRPIVLGRRRKQRPLARSPRRRLLCPPAEREVWRLSVPPAAGAEVVQHILASWSATPSTTGAAG